MTFGVFPIAGASTTPPVYPAGSTPNALGTNGFIPEIWSGKLVEKFYAATVLAAISNTDYEGEIKNQGDKVYIRTKPTITINDYRADGDLSVQRPEGSYVDLDINQAKYFNLILDDVMEVQSDLNVLSIWADDASEQFKITVDTAVLLGLLNTPVAANRGTAAGAITSSINLGVTGTPLAVVANSPSVGQVDILDVILRLGQTLDEQNIPETGRWVVLPTWASTLIKRSELRQAYLSGDAVSMLRNGRMGMVDRFTLYSSNLLPSGVSAGLASGEYVIYAGHAHGLTFASQFTKLETIRSERTFGTLLRGLQVYGYKTVDGKALTQAIVTKA
jgi:hypothetical protein